MEKESMSKVQLIKAKTRELPIATYETIDAGLAQTYLDTAAPNRNLVFRKIEQYAEMMKRGDWLMSGQGIVFDERGRLLDGQHRLHAIIRVDQPVTILVVRNVRDIAQLVMDQGARRTPHDQIKLREGFDVQPVHVAVAKSMIRSVGGEGVKAREITLTDIQLLDRYYFKHRKAIEFAVGTYWRGAKTIKGVTIAPVFAPVARAYYTNDQEILRRFIDVVVTGMAESKDEGAAVVLRNYLIAARDAGKALSARAGKDRYTIYKKSEVALRAFIAGETIQRLGQMTTEHELFPMPGEKVGK